MEEVGGDTDPMDALIGRTGIIVGDRLLHVEEDPHNNNNGNTEHPYHLRSGFIEENLDFPVDGGRQILFRDFIPGCGQSYPGDFPRHHLGQEIL